MAAKNNPQREDPEGKLERHAPWGFVVLGVGMIAVAAVAGLPDALAVAFAVLGTGLVALGGLAARLEGPFEIGTGGLKAVLRVQQAAREAQRVAEQEQRPEDAERYGEVVEVLDDWFAAYAREPRDPSPFTQAMRLQRAYEQRQRHRRRTEPQRPERRSVDLHPRGELPGRSPRPLGPATPAGLGAVGGHPRPPCANVRAAWEPHPYGTCTGHPRSGRREVLRRTVRSAS